MDKLEEMQKRLLEVESRLNVVDSMRRQSSVEIDETTKGRNVSVKIYFDPTNLDEARAVVENAIATMLFLGERYNHERVKI
jgi:hypothetical protein